MDEQAVFPRGGGAGSKDGEGAGDHDEPFGGWRVYPFPTRQFARLLALRGEALDARMGVGRFAEDLRTAAA